MSEMMIYINDGACHRYVSNTVNIHKRNLMVIAKLDNGFFYPGHVIQQWGKPEEAEVNFYQWGRRRVHRNNVISIGGAVSCPPLHVWDYVLTRVRVMGPSGMYMQYMPGRVCYVPRLPPLEHRFYSVRLYNGKVVEKKRKLLVKIGKSRYRRILSCIGLDGCLRESLERQPEKEKHCSTTKIEKEIQTLGNRIDQNGDKIGQEIQTSRIQISERLIALERQMERETEQNEVNVQIIDAKINTVSLEMTEEIRATGEKIVNEIKAIGDKCCKMTPVPPHPRPPPPPPSPPPPVAAGLKVGDEVLAKWADDGWYYFGQVVRRSAHGFVWVKDSCGHMEEIGRDSILTEEDRIRPPMTNTNYVIAPLPRYIDSFGPGKIINGGSEIEFFNGDIVNVRRDLYIYKITKEKYERDIKDIKEREEDMQGKEVLVLDKDTGRFILTTIENPLGKETFKTAQGREEPGKFILPQKQISVSDAARKKWKYVAAPVEDETYYLPARVNWSTNNRKPSITYCNGTRKTAIDIIDCYYLNDKLYNLSADLYKRNEQNIRF